MSQGHATKCVDNRVCDFENKEKYNDQNGTFKLD